MEEKPVAYDGHEGHAAPFVVKTYQMVNDPRTDVLIRWGMRNNSFLVLNPAEFSQFLLPCYFKHNNFSSFVRQLNTYGFRKVDPDRWEFAHESFLRGQTHLLPLILRRKKKKSLSNEQSSSNSRAKDSVVDEDEDEDVLVKEVTRLRQEQRLLEEELQGMNKRIQATERRPQQMMLFLAKAADEPESLSRLILSKKQQFAAEKRRRLVNSPITSTSTTTAPLTLTGPLMELGFNEEVITTHSVDEEKKPLYTVSSSVAGIEPSGWTEFGLEPEPKSASATDSVPFPFSLLGRGFFS
ncbi:heat stress transcription factor C-1b-like [Ananas comosus]|uniref:Heat stress transcription factor C-1b-like n=1 Tax=Ananas comosus TaxID=4615 RepID=A0A6P5GAD9_ANACO|nr:heat stress transcription factor C-1b-like [Ananas comosus]